MFQKKESTPNFPKNEHFLLPDTHTKHFLPPDTHKYVCVSGGKNCSFFGKFGVLSFLETPVLRFALLPYYWRKNTRVNKVNIIRSIYVILCTIWYNLHNSKNVRNSLKILDTQITSNYERKNFVKNSTKTATWKLVPGPFVFFQRIKQTPIG